MLLKTTQLYAQGFTVSGTKLLDANGNEFIIKGINNPHIWFPEESFKALKRIAECNVNCIRIVWETIGEAKELEKVIKACIKLEMIPMVELHDATGNNKKEKLLELCSYYVRPEIKEILLKYKKYILINIANEWGDYFMTADQWKEAYVEAIDSLRNSGFETTLVIDGPNWGQKLDPILDYGNELLQHDPMHNLLFSVHMYGFWNDPQKVDSSLQKAYNLSLPLIVGEFGYNFDNGNNNLECKVDHYKIITKCNELGYGLIPWSWSGNDQKNAWLNITKPEDWKTPTWWGKEVLEGAEGIVNTANKASVFINK